jgi:hypothetical protein
MVTVSGIPRNAMAARQRLNTRGQDRTKFALDPLPMSRDSADGIGTSYGLDDGGVSSSRSRVKNFHFSVSFRPAMGSTQPIKWVQGALSPGVKRHEADHSAPTSAEVKKMWVHSPIRLHGVVLI